MVRYLCVMDAGVPRARGGDSLRVACPGHCAQGALRATDYLLAQVEPPEPPRSEHSYRMSSEAVNAVTGVNPAGDRPDKGGLYGYNGEK